MTLEQLTTRVEEIAQMAEPALALAIISFFFVILFTFVICGYFENRISKLEKAQELCEEKEEKRLERKRIVDEIIDYFERTK